MDVNNTRFHLVYGKADWERCIEETADLGEVRVAWDDDDDKPDALTLSPKISLFPRGRRDLPLQPAARRGAGVDRYGNWYWIANDRCSLFWMPAGSGQPAVYWSQSAKLESKAPGTFRSSTDGPATAELAGLAVTEHHYLVVGNATQGGVFVFDLHAGGEPLLLLFPPEVPFEPFDLAAAPGGGVWVLDRAHRAYWGLDGQFRAVVDSASMQEVEPETQATFQPTCPVGAVRAIVCPARQFPEGFALEVLNPIAIEALPGGGVLVLDSPVATTPTEPSTLYHYYYDHQMSPPLPLPSLEGVIAGDDVRPVVGHDFAYVPAKDPDGDPCVLGRGTLYVVERDGNQAIAFALDLLPDASPPEPIRVKREYLPMHAFGSRALVARGTEVFYDVGGGDKDGFIRWVRLHNIEQPRYERSAELITPVLDGKERDCVWHRLFVDACIPPATAVEVWTRAGNDEGLLGSVPFVPEPSLYLRGAGAELPYYNPYPEGGSEDAGTWEMLFQAARGRYMQVKLVLTGNGRATPRLQALRAYYPRFSYPKRFLPTVYQEDAESARFLERLLANPEGFYTEIEGKIVQISALFDARSAPTEVLDWLANWVGVVLDPLWAQIREPVDRRRLFIRFAMRLYSQRATVDGIRFALYLLLHPCLEALLERFKSAAVEDDPALRGELDALGLLYPTPTMSEEQLEDLLQGYLLHPQRPSDVRVVERFLAREGRAVAAGDPTEGSVPVSQETIQASAHRFSVLVPMGLSVEEETMVERIVELEKPAHTAFTVRRYWDYFRVGEVRVGLDTVLGEAGQFIPMILGRDDLAEGYLYPAYPMNVSERWILDRDALLGKAPGCAEMSGILGCQ
jgi:phage tail-like protein